MKRFIFIIILMLLGCENSLKIERLPDAKLNKNYSEIVNFTNKFTFEDQTQINVYPENSGLNASIIDGDYNTVQIKGIPNSLQDIEINIYYSTPKMTLSEIFGFSGIDHEVKYKIKVVE